MRTKKYPVRLEEIEAKELKAIINAGKHPATIVKRANILLQLDESNGKSRTQKEIAEICHCCITTINKLSRRYAESGLNSVMARREAPPRKRIVTGEVEARIIQLACSQPPQGYSRWTLRLLEKKVVEMNIVPAISDNTIGRLLKKHHLSLI